MSAGMRSGVHWMRLSSMPEYRAERLDQSRLGEAGNADEQGMAAGEQGDQRLIDHLALAEDDAADALADEREARAQRFDIRQKLVRIIRHG